MSVLDDLSKLQYNKKDLLQSNPQIILKKQTNEKTLKYTKNAEDWIESEKGIPEKENWNRLRFLPMLSKANLQEIKKHQTVTTTRRIKKIKCNGFGPFEIYFKDRKS